MQSTHEEELSCGNARQLFMKPDSRERIGNDLESIESLSAQSSAPRSCSSTSSEGQRLAHRADFAWLSGQQSLLHAAGWVGHCPWSHQKLPGSACAASIRAVSRRRRRARPRLTCYCLDRAITASSPHTGRALIMCSGEWPNKDGGRKRIWRSPTFQT